MEWIVMAVDVERNLVVQALMRAVVVVFHLPQLQLVATFFRVTETKLVEQLLFVGSIAALDKAVAPGLAFVDQGMDTATAFYHFGKTSFAFGVSRVMHGETHGVIGEGDKKGGSTSIDRLKTSAMVALS
jgi:hypothetical protein